MIGVALRTVEVDAVDVVECTLHRGAYKAREVRGEEVAADHVGMDLEVDQQDLRCAFTRDFDQLHGLVGRADRLCDLRVASAGICARCAVLHAEAANERNVLEFLARDTDERRLHVRDRERGRVRHAAEKHIVVQRVLRVQAVVDGGASVSVRARHKHGIGRQSGALRDDFAADVTLLPVDANDVETERDGSVLAVPKGDRVYIQRVKDPCRAALAIVALHEDVEGWRDIEASETCFQHL